MQRKGRQFDAHVLHKMCEDSMTSFKILYILKLIQNSGILTFFGIRLVCLREKQRRTSRHPMQHEGKMFQVPMTFHVPAKLKKRALPGDSIQNSFCVWPKEVPRIVEPPKPTMKRSHFLEDDPTSPYSTTKQKHAEKICQTPNRKQK